MTLNINNTNDKDVYIYEHLQNEVVFNLTGFELDAYLLAYEGWRRGLRLKWYLAETNKCKLARLGGTTLGRFFSLETKEKKHYFLRSRGDYVSNDAVKTVQNKEATKNILKKSSIPVPIGKEFNVEEVEDIIKFANEIGYPVIMKPTSGSMGRGVTTNIMSEDELLEVIKYFKSKFSYKTCLIEKHYYGKEYRIYVVGENVIAATYRAPANVVGDGQSTIKQLIKEKNKIRKLNPYLAAKPIRIDNDIKRNLQKLGMTEQSILEKGEKVFLRTLSNLSAGGDPIDETDHLPNEVKQIAIDSLKVLPSIPHAGVDIIVNEDRPSESVLLEVNATAEIAFHLFPITGKSRDVPKAIVDYYFPKTTKRKKSQFYFDYESLLDPLRTWSAAEISVMLAPRKKLNGMKYIIEGDFDRDSFKEWIKRLALRRKLHGYIKDLTDNKVEVFVVGTNPERFETFFNVIEKGNKTTTIIDIKSEAIKIKDTDYFQIGFQIK